VQIMAKTQEWLFYKIPPQFQRVGNSSGFVGQKQKWFLLELISDESLIKLDSCFPAEFDRWKWVDYWYPLTTVVEFKKEIYRQVLKEFEPIVLSLTKDS
jgi:putative (di)nucleoside polyphosphate hydrolase